MEVNNITKSMCSLSTWATGSSHYQNPTGYCWESAKKSFFSGLKKGLHQEGIIEMAFAARNSLKP